MTDEFIVSSFSQLYLNFQLAHSEWCKAKKRSSLCAVCVCALCSAHVRGEKWIAKKTLHWCQVWRGQFYIQKCRR